MGGALLQSASVTAEPLTLSLDKSSVSGSGTGPSTCGNPGSTDTATATASGGTAPYTYAWTRSGGAATSPHQANAATSSFTAFSNVSSSACDGDLVTSETWKCTVTDANSQTAFDTVTTNLTWADNR